MSIPENNSAINRRAFLRAAGVCAGCSLMPFGPKPPLPQFVTSAFADEPTNPPQLHIAEFYKSLEGLEIECELCPRKCAVGDRERGFCGVRENRNGKYYTLVYGNPCSTNIDQIEKKPFFHYKPGSMAFSLATAGCNLNCKFCQNWQISQFRPEQIRSFQLSPSQVAQLAQSNSCDSIAYTYSEPTIFYEYMCDCAVEGNRRNVKSALVTAGYIQKEPMQKLIPYLAAVKVDLKAFTEKYYADICNAELAPVLETLKLLKSSGIWFEIVYLMVPTLNDDPADIRRMCQWIGAELGPDVPVHFTRFHPEYLLKNLPSTPIKSLEIAYNIALEEKLNFPYIGNVYGHKGENTYCPGCKSEIVSRNGFQILKFDIDNRRCKKCGQTIPGIWT